MSEDRSIFPSPEEARDASLLRIVQEIILNTVAKTQGRLKAQMSDVECGTVLGNYLIEMKTYMMMLKEHTTHAYMHGRADLRAAMHRQEVREFTDHEALDESIELNQYQPPTDAPYMQHPIHGHGGGRNM